MLCLTMLRAIMLERRPISIITRAIDVLVTSYAHLVKLENAFQGGDKSSKRTKDSGGQSTITSNAVSVESGETMSRGKSIIEAVENEPKRSTIRELDNDNVNLEKSCSKASFNSLSDSDGDANFDAIRSNSGDSLGNPLLTNLLFVQCYFRQKKTIILQTNSIDIWEKKWRTSMREHQIRILYF